MAREPAGAVHVFGIRHHGPGSARSLERALERLAPDVVLIEGPPEADALIALAADDEMRPPVALLIYRPDVPRRAVYYPFAEFSPEWRAIRFAIGRGVPARFIDLPQGHQLIDEPEAPPPDDSAAPLTPPARDDPLGSLAAAAGYDDGETFWEQLVEHRRSDDAACSMPWRRRWPSCGQCRPSLIASARSAEKRTCGVRFVTRSGRGSSESQSCAARGTRPH
jgi:hypothetical protein